MVNQDNQTLHLFKASCHSSGHVPPYSHISLMFPTSPVFPVLPCLSLCVCVLVLAPGPLPAHLPPNSASTLQYIYPGSSLVLRQIVASTTVVVSCFWSLRYYIPMSYPRVFVPVLTLSPCATGSQLSCLTACSSACLPAPALPQPAILTPSSQSSHALPLSHAPLPSAFASQPSFIFTLPVVTVYISETYLCCLTELVYG